MWSFEKIHRCMAHLFLGQLVSTFDEEFRILFAQSQPLNIENVPAPMEEFNPLQKRQYPHERTSLYRPPRKFHPDDDRTDIDWRMMPLKNPSDPHRRFSSMQSLVDPSLDPGHSRMPTMESPAFKRHSFAEGGHGRYSYPFLPSQELPDLESQGRHFDRGQQSNVRAGPEANYSGYDKFWSQDKSGHSPDEYSDPGLPQDTDNFDPVLNYLSSTRNVEFDEGSDSFLPAGDLPLSSSYPRRLSLDQPYACQTSPTPSNPTDQKQFFPPSSDRKDPMVKRGLRNYRISSYLSAFDNPGDEGLPLAPPHVPDPLDEQSNPAIQQKKAGMFSVPKIPQFREFKVPALRRASQMPNYVKHVRERSEKSPDESTAVEVETKSTPTPSESSSTTEGDKTEEAEQNEPKEPKTGVLRREESFRRKYNPAVPRSSRLRSSLIFSSLDQQTSAGQQDEEGDKNEAEQTKLPYVSKILGQKRKEPFEWRSYIKSATFDSSGLEASKPDDGTSKAEERDSSSKDENSKNPPENPEVQESLKQSNVAKATDSPSMPQSNSSEAELPKTDQLVQPPISLVTPLFLDMNDPDERLKFFKEMAAKRRAAKSAEAEKSTVHAPMKAITDLNVSDETKKWGSQVNIDPNTSKCCEEEQTTVSTDSEKIEMKNNQAAASLPVCAEIETPQSEPPEDTKLSKHAVKEPSPCLSPITTTTNANVPSLVQGTDKSEKPNSIPQTTHSPTAFSFAPLSTPTATVSSDITQEDSSSTPTSSILSPISDKIEAKECVSHPLPELAQSVDEALQTYTSSDMQAESTQALLDSVGVDSSHVEFDISPDKCAAGSVPSSLESTTKTNSEESCWILSDSQKDASPKDTKADSITPSLSSPSTERCLPIGSDLESGNSDQTSDQKGAITPKRTPGHAADEQSGTSSLVTPDIPPDASQSETGTCSQDASKLANYPSELYLTGSDSPTPADSIPCSSPLSESVGSVMSPEAEKTETNMPVLHSSSDAISFTSETPSDSNSALHPTESSFSPTEPTSIVTSVTTEPDLPSKRSESVTSESHTSESSVPADISFTDEHELSEPFEEANVDTEATNKVNNSTTRESNDQARQNNSSKVAEAASDEVVPLSPQSEKPKSRYHSSTAKVLSSSNLRDDTKLLLGQISANSQNRNEMTKELPVTDDEKEDKADKNTIRAKESGIRSFSRAPPKSAEERKELLEKIQSMRKERKVYSRFEV